MKYKNYYSSILDLSQLISDNSSKRFNCVDLEYCRGKDSLSITKEKGKLKWHCFKCGNVRGDKTYTANTSELKSRLNAHTAVKEEFKLPQHLIHGLSSKNTVKMLTNGHCMEPYLNNLFDAAYDPEQDRVCFVVKKSNKIVGLIGKAYNRETKPRTLNYPNSDLSQAFIVGNTDTIVLVEDCLSAASIARVSELSGLALLGSYLKAEYIPLIMPYSKVIVALDRDARRKALDIKNKLRYYKRNVKIWLLEKDIKDLDSKELLLSYETLK